jgi:class 3 adenylate cyclase
MHADVVGSTTLVQLDESLAHQRIQDTFRRISDTIASHAGTTHEIRGDALVAEFSRVSDAVSASTAFQIASTAHKEFQDDALRQIATLHTRGAAKSAASETR